MDTSPTALAVTVPQSNLDPARPRARRQRAASAAAKKRGRGVELALARQAIQAIDDSAEQSLTAELDALLDKHTDGQHSRDLQRARDAEARWEASKNERTAKDLQVRSDIPAYRERIRARLIAMIGEVNSLCNMMSDEQEADGYGSSANAKHDNDRYIREALWRVRGDLLMCMATPAQHARELLAATKVINDTHDQDHVVGAAFVDAHQRNIMNMAFAAGALEYLFIPGKTIAEAQSLGDIDKIGL